jgi:hypothetical protein
MISASSDSKKNASSPEPIQIDTAQYKPLSQGKKGLKAQGATSMESGALENGDVRSQ